MFFTFLGFLCFLLFWAFYVFYFFGVDKGISLAPTYSLIAMSKSDLRSSLRTECLLSYFYLFERLILVANKSRLRHWTSKQSFDFFEKRRESLRRWTLKRSLGVVDKSGAFAPTYPQLR